MQGDTHGQHANAERGLQQARHLSSNDRAPFGAAPRRLSAPSRPAAAS